MNKRGQVYVLAAIVMSIIIYGMVTISNRVVQDSVASDFERIANNYATETSRLVNSVAGKGDMLSSFRNFTVMFASYAKAQSPRFELISVFDNNKKIYIGNFLKEKIIVTCDSAACNNLNPLTGCYQTVPATISFDGFEVPFAAMTENIIKCEGEIDYSSLPAPTYIDISVGNVAYRFNLEREQPDVIVVSWETNAKQRKVFTKGSFISSAGNIKTLSEYCVEKSCAGNDYGGYCVMDSAPCRPNCGIIASEEECLINNVQCGWDADIKKCVEAAA